MEQNWKANVSLVMCLGDWDGQEQKTKMVKACTESQKSGKQRGCGKRTGGKRRSLMKKYRAGGGKCNGQYAADTYTDIYRELESARYK